MTARHTAELSETEKLRTEVAILRAQFYALQDIVLSVRSDLAQPSPIADGLSLMSPKQAAHVTGLSRSAIQKLITAGKIGAKWWRGRWFIDPETLPRRR